jgi:Transposase IS66 family
MLLRALHVTVEDTKATGEQSLDPWTLAGYRAADEQIIVLGHQQNPPGTIPTGKRGVIKQTPARNLLVRLDRDREQVMRFAHDFRVPFDNNLAEAVPESLLVHASDGQGPRSEEETWEAFSAKETLQEAIAHAPLLWCQEVHAPSLP